MERGVDNGQRPAVDKDQQRADLASDELSLCREQTADVNSHVEHDVLQVPSYSQWDEQSENDHHHFDDLPVMFCRRHVANCHLLPPQHFPYRSAYNNVA